MTPLRAAVWTFLVVVVLGTIVGVSAVMATTERDYGRRAQRFEQGTAVGTGVGVAAVLAAGLAYVIQDRRRRR